MTANAAAADRRAQQLLVPISRDSTGGYIVYNYVSALLVIQPGSETCSSQVKMFAIEGILENCHKQKPAATLSRWDSTKGKRALVWHSLLARWESNSISMIQNEGSNLYAMLTWIYKAHALITRTDSCGKSAVMWHGKPFQRKTVTVHTSFHLISLLQQGLLLLHPILRLKPSFISWKLSGNMQIADRILTSMGFESRPWMLPC